MELSSAGAAIATLAGVFALLMLLLRLHVRLWLTIMAGTLALAVLCGIHPALWPGIVLGVLQSKEFLLLCLMIYLILMLSSVQEATGQSRRLVAGLEAYLRKPRIRLVIFPALVGLLPMPGGALFSCPMTKDAAAGMGISDQKKALINYWFRHIWELAWPLYPGYALTCSLLGIPVTLLWQYTFPLVLLAFAVGWLFYMRTLYIASPGKVNGNPAQTAAPADSPPMCEQGGSALGMVLTNALPIIIVLAGAGVFGWVIDLLLPSVPGQAAFSLSLLCAIGVALYQGKGRMQQPLRALLFSPNARKILLLLLAIYIFKDTLVASGLVNSLSHIGQGPLMLLFACLLVPFVAGLLTGIMVGFVGIAFPILLGLLTGSPLEAYTLPLIIAALIAGNAGQLLSPLHVCLVVTCEYFTTALGGVWRQLALPVAILALGGLAWVGILLSLGVRL